MAPLTRMFSGGASKQAAAAQAESARQRELQEIAQRRQEELLRAREQETARETRATGRPARGRKLLEWAGAPAPAETLGS